MKKGFIVTGATSSGNHLMTEVLVNSGVTGRIKSIDGQLLREWISEGSENVVWRGSVPKGGLNWNGGLFEEPKKGFWDIAKLYNYFIYKGYVPYLIIMHRDYYATISSQMKVYPEWVKSINEGLQRMIETEEHIAKEIGLIIDVYGKDTNLINVTYESLVYQKEQTLEGLSKLLDFPLSNSTIITNENRKYK